MKKTALILAILLVVCATAMSSCQILDVIFQGTTTTTPTTTVKPTPTPTPTPDHTHTLEHVEGKEPTCTEQGTVEHWVCSECNKTFSDAAGVKEITSTTIPTAAHELTAHEKVDATCTEAGVEAYWECGNCHKLFSDEEGKTEIEAPVAIPAGHTAEHHDKVDATCTEAGTIEYWHCTGCEKNFSDEACTTEVTSLVIEAKGHTAEHHEKVDATCAEAGTIEYWHCTACEKNFSDAECKNEVTDLAIAAKGHTTEHFEKVDATCTEAGKIEYWHCSVCQKNFSDAECKNEVTELTIDSLGGHKWDEGSNFTKTHGTWTCLTCGHTEEGLLIADLSKYPMLINGHVIADNGGTIYYDEINDVYYIQGASARQYFANTKNTTGEYIISATIKGDPLDCIKNGESRHDPVQGIMITSGANYTSTIRLKSCWWEGGHLCIEINGKEIAITGFTHGITMNTSNSTITITVKRHDDVFYVYDSTNALVVTLDRDGVHPQGGRTIVDADKKATQIEYINEHLKEFFDNGVENISGPIVQGSPIGKLTYDLTYADLTTVTGNVGDAKGDIYVDYTGAFTGSEKLTVAEDGTFSVAVPTGTYNLSFRATGMKATLENVDTKNCGALSLTWKTSLTTGNATVNGTQIANHNTNVTDELTSALANGTSFITTGTGSGLWGTSRPEYALNLSNTVTSKNFAVSSELTVVTRSYGLLGIGITDGTYALYVQLNTNASFSGEAAGTLRVTYATPWGNFPTSKIYLSDAAVATFGEIGDSAKIEVKKFSTGIDIYVDGTKLTTITNSEIGSEFFVEGREYCSGIVCQGISGQISQKVEYSLISDAE